MSDNFILDFPVLKKDGDDFKDGVSYEVEASRSGRHLEIIHTLKGQSFISRLVKNGDAKFSVLLFYPDSSDRYCHPCTAADITGKDSAIVATQTISIKFSYAPQITPSIVLLKDTQISVDASSGLTDFWKRGERFDIPQYSRIALGSKLKFTSGDVSNLMKVEFDENLKDGEMKVAVNEFAGEGETPVSLLCGQGVYNELRKVKQAEPSSAVESMRSAIVTQALCAVYAYMQKLVEEHKDKEYKASGVLLAHQEMLEDKTGENWESGNFDPSLAATKMQPYVVKALYGEAGDA